MNWNPFRIFKDVRKLKEQMDEVKAIVAQQAQLIGIQATNLGQALAKLREMGFPVPLRQPGVDLPLSDEEKLIVEEFLKNSKLPEQIRRGFASGGTFETVIDGMPVKFGEIKVEPYPMQGGDTKE
ncbi:hypothetical protein HOV23_gp132 [Pseudomonas phage Lana]|uniref:Uncharacterized protein n=1 Tax=Pseudomonas phage Lana TaxID=2530172 RepID=A0A481W5S9_9CAUD|nr:hypothetical protein HOV23_gp132 [Pseudomonas phage Lana]QBJ04441.1 hypothetical protein [Pseudomonas phage Lana]